KIVVQKVLSSLEKVDLILLVLDVNEILPEDYQIIEKLRKYSSKVILVLNKVDTKDKEILAHEFHNLIIF
ncbi:GTP-binding protein, partial [Borreliella garinii]|uniref:GTP-binding protein n=1 Tax=Borreliella garinii TaxID=29519 RepID=UPI001AEFB09D